MKNFLGALVLFATLSVSTPSFSGYLIEPYLGYSLNDYKSGAKKYDLNGATYGVRLGYEAILVWGALEYQGAQQKAKGHGVSTDGDASRLGVVAGLTSPFGVRAWLGYFLKDEIKFKSGAIKGKEKGKGFKLGMGYRLVPFLYANLEYQSSSYNKVDGEKVSPKHSIHGFLLSLSVPFSL